ncbi:MAG: DUF433 domain-containing protein [Chloroflexota bacterium]|nr:DUF433 domain-containing protein [Chloroflexota bacterium]
MSLIETRYEHIVLDDAGRPLIAGTTMKVIELVEAQFAYGWSPEELHFQHPYLALGQIYSALAYYWDHRAEIDAEIQRDLAWVEQLRQSAPPSPVVARLRAQGFL